MSKKVIMWGDFILLGLVVGVVAFTVLAFDVVVGGMVKEVNTVDESVFCSSGLEYVGQKPKHCQTGLEWLTVDRLEVVQSSNVEQANSTGNLVQPSVIEVQGSADE